MLGVVEREDGRSQWSKSLFTGVEQYRHFNRLHELFPVSELPASDNPVPFALGAPMRLPEAYGFEGETRFLETFLAETETSALLVLKDGALVFEDYWLTGGRDVTWMSMSVAKSFISALVGIAIDEGFITSIEEPVTQYAPGLKGSAYDNVRIKDILQMSSGARWNEDYSNPEADVVQFVNILAYGGSFNKFAATLQREREPGAFVRYNSSDTQVLGLLLVNATKRTITDYMNEKLWRPLGASRKAFWMLDSEGMEMAYGGFNATARDYARIGELYRNGGVFNGRRIVPEQWVRDSITADAPHLQPDAEKEAGVHPIGYGYQWWLPKGDQGEFSAIGVYNQFVYVNPAKGVVITKLSANRGYGTSASEAVNRNMESFEVFRAIADAAV